MIYRPEVSRYPVYDFNRSERICEKYYSRTIIEELSKLFSNVQVHTVHGQLYLGFNEGFNHHFPVSSSLMISHYKCQNCGSSYLVNMQLNSPILPDKGIMEGKLGSVYLHEIVRIAETLTNIESQLFPNLSI